MQKRILWVVMGCLSVFSLLMVSCGQAVAPATGTTSTTPASSITPTATQQVTVKPGGEAPKYGGTAILCNTVDITSFDLIQTPPGGGVPKDYTNERIWDGDWTKGSAGGYGTKQTNWGGVTNIDALKTGYLAESVTWAFDAADNTQVVTTLKIRQGVRWALNPNSEASRLVNGRELTADDIVYNLNIRRDDPKSWAGKAFPGLKEMKVTKTGPRDVQFTLPASSYMTVRMILLDGGFIFPPEIINKYGDMTRWENSVGTGPFCLTDYISGSSLTLKKNPNYWMKDPIGPGKGSQLPYLDSIKSLIIVDESTRLAALRTGKIFQLGRLNRETTNELTQTAPQLLKSTTNPSMVGTIQMRTDKAPFSDIRVRRAMMMATDFEAINKGLYYGEAQILTWPYFLQPGYEDLYLGLNDPAMPASVKELYTYNPDKAKQLLKEAGYPNGFKTSIICTTAHADYLSIIASDWAKVGIELSLDQKENTVWTNVINARTHEQLVVAMQPPPGSWPEAAAYSMPTQSNCSMIDDPICNKAIAEWTKLAITDQKAAMNMTKELMKYVLDQAWVIPANYYPTFALWWPWLKNYSGEANVGWQHSAWARWVWLDQDLMKSMGH
jgi:peptide/nickel transport system substrate-binding protein